MFFFSSGLLIQLAPPVELLVHLLQVSGHQPRLIGVQRRATGLPVLQRRLVKLLQIGVQHHPEEIGLNFACYGLWKWSIWGNDIKQKQFECLCFFFLKQLKTAWMVVSCQFCQLVNKSGKVACEFHRVTISLLKSSLLQNVILQSVIF